MTKQENDKIYQYLKDKGIKIDKDDTLEYYNHITYFKVGSKFFITPQFIFNKSKDSFTFDEAIKSDAFLELYNSEYEDMFKVIKRNISRRKQDSCASLEVKNLRTDEVFTLLRDPFQLEPTSTFHLLLLM